MKTEKTFRAKGKVIKDVRAFACNDGKGGVKYVTNRGYADAMNSRFGAPVIPARETFEGAA
jgi:hypothetical protein